MGGSLEGSISMLDEDREHEFRMQFRLLSDVEQCAIVALALSLFEQVENPADLASADEHTQ